MTYDPMRGLEFTDGYAVADDIIKYIQSSSDSHDVMRERILSHIGLYKLARHDLGSGEMKLAVMDARNKFRHSLSESAK
jgi:hypothetical protein